MTIEDRIAKIVYGTMNGRVWPSTGPYESLKECDRTPYPIAARAILDEPEIKEALGLMAQKKKDDADSVHIVHAENYSGMHCSMCCAEWNDKRTGCAVCEAAAAAPLPIEEAQASAKEAQSGL